jgi:hypothetical protein
MHVQLKARSMISADSLYVRRIAVAYFVHQVAGSSEGSVSKEDEEESRYASREEEKNEIPTRTRAPKNCSNVIDRACTLIFITC